MSESGALTRLFLLRHAESTWNAQGLWQGHGDPPLSERGSASARACIPELRALATQLVVTSDLERARETAQIIAYGLGLALEIDPRWREWDVGGWTGRTHREIRESWPELYRAVRGGDPAATPPGGESRGALLRRLRAALGSIAVRHAGKRILVVTHRGAILSLLPGSNPEHLAVHRLEAGGAPALASQREESSEHPAGPE